MWAELNAQQKDAVKAGFILAIVLIGGVGAYYWYMAKPAITTAKATIEKTNTEITGLRERMKEMEVSAANMEELKRKQKLLAEVAAKLPSTIAPQEFFHALDKILQVAQIDVSELQPESLLPREIYTEIPYKIIGRGRYHDFGQFLNLIEENPDRLMRVKTFTIENDDNRPSIHPMTVELATFKLEKKG
jgi:Tfp pilus assembly protein PilO